MIVKRKGGRRNPASFTKKGNRMMRHIERRQTPGIAAATVRAAAKRGVPGLVKKKRNPVKRHGDFVRAAAEFMWERLYDAEIYNLREDGYEELYDEESGRYPNIPEVAYENAEKFEEKVVTANGVGSILDLMARAAEADGTDIDQIDEEEFGRLLMASALGEGAGWFDDHGDFDLHLPRWEPSPEVHNEMYDYLEELKSKYEDEEDEEDEDEEDE